MMCLIQCSVAVYDAQDVHARTQERRLQALRDLDRTAAGMAPHAGTAAQVRAAWPAVLGLLSDSSAGIRQAAAAALARMGALAARQPPGRSGVRASLTCTALTGLTEMVLPRLCDTAAAAHCQSKLSRAPCLLAAALEHEVPACAS